jgi:putative redox protein
MVQASVTWQGEMVFRGEGSGGAPPVAIQSGAADGVRQGVRPKELALLSLASCSAADVVSILEKMRQPLAGLSYRVEADEAPEHPKWLRTVRVVVEAQGEGLVAERVVRAVQLSMDRYCGVTASLRSEVHYRVVVNGEVAQPDALAHAMEEAARLS